MATKFNNKDRVALKNDIKHRGFIYQAYPKHQNDEDEMYTVQWDKNGMFLYVVGALISEAEANKLQAEIDANDAKKAAVDDKFKSMEKNEDEKK